MAKAKKAEQDEQLPEVTATSDNAAIEEETSQSASTAQTVVIEEIAEPPVAAQETQEEDTDEMAFLRLIQSVQSEGGWGTHLNPMINERIAKLKAK